MAHCLFGAGSADVVRSARRCGRWPALRRGSEPDRIRDLARMAAPGGCHRSGGGNGCQSCRAACAARPTRGWGCAPRAGPLSGGSVPKRPGLVEASRHSSDPGFGRNDRTRAAQAAMDKRPGSARSGPVARPAGPGPNRRPHPAYRRYRAALAAWLGGAAEQRGRRAGGVAAQAIAEQHAAATFVMILAVAIGVFAAIGLGLGPEPQVTSHQPALGAGLGAGLLVGTVIALALALAAFGLHFRSAARRRFQEYSGMLAHGLAIADLTRSLAKEQASVTMSALVVGSLLGLALAVAGLPLARPTGLALQLAAASLASALVCLLLAMLIAGSVARRLPIHANPFD